MESFDWQEGAAGTGKAQGDGTQDGPESRTKDDRKEGPPLGLGRPGQQRLQLQRRRAVLGA